jgi:hypothetical protein
MNRKSREVATESPRPIPQEALDWYDEYARGMMEGAVI